MSDRIPIRHRTSNRDSQDTSGVDHPMLGLNQLDWPDIAAHVRVQCFVEATTNRLCEPESLDAALRVSTVIEIASGVIQLPNDRSTSLTLFGTHRQTVWERAVRNTLETIPATLSAHCLAIDQSETASPKRQRVEGIYLLSGPFAATLLLAPQTLRSICRTTERAEAKDAGMDVNPVYAFSPGPDSLIVSTAAPEKPGKHQAQRRAYDHPRAGRVFVALFQAAHSIWNHDNALRPMGIAILD